MRSRLTCSPAARAQATTSGIRAGSCVRSSVASTCGTADCIPKLTRVKPAAASSARLRSSTESGFASVVTSAPGARPQVSRMPASRLARSETGSRVGVPPPKKTVDAGRGSAPVAASTRCRLRDLGERLPGVVALLHPADLGRRVGVEVAVSAAHPAERHVHVDAERAIAPSRPRPSTAAARQRAPGRRSGARRASCDSRRA